MLAVTNVDSWLLLLRLLLAIILLHIIARLVQPRIGFVPKDKTVKDRLVKDSIPHQVIVCLPFLRTVVKKKGEKNLPERGNFGLV